MKNRIAVTLTVVMMIGSSASAVKLKFDENKTNIEEIELKGDLRFRQENFDKSHGQVDRERQRFRYRQEINIKLPNNLKVKTRLATGSDDPVSTNQSLQDNASTKDIRLDRAYLEWKPMGPVKIQTGKVKNPFWESKVKNLVWDSDYNPEGITESFDGVIGSFGWTINLGQFRLDEISGSTKDPYLFTEELGGEIKLPAESRFKLAVAHHEFTNVKKNVPTNSGSGNTAGTPFSVFQLHGSLTTWLFGVPVGIEGNTINNSAARKTTLGGALSTPKALDTGVMAGFFVGKAKQAKSWELSWFWKEIDNDAFLQGVNDSDFHDGALNSKGHVSNVSYAITDFVMAAITHFDTEDKVVAPGATDGSFTRTQFDLSVKFK